MEGKRRGYRKIVDEESGSTEQGKKTVIATYRPSRGLSKVVEKDIEYKTSTSPRNKLTIKEKTKKYNDGSVKSYEHIVKQNGNIVPEVTKPKVKYKKGEKPFGQKVGPSMTGEGDGYKRVGPVPGNTGVHKFTNPDTGESRYALKRDNGSFGLLTTDKSGKTPYTGEKPLKGKDRDNSVAALTPRLSSDK